MKERKEERVEVPFVEKSNTDRSTKSEKEAKSCVWDPLSVRGQLDINGEVMKAAGYEPVVTER